MVLADGSFVTARRAAAIPTCSGRCAAAAAISGSSTSFTFRLHPVSTVMAGPYFYAVEDAPAVMRRYEQFITNAPEEINGFFAFLIVPPVPLFPAELHMRTVCGVIWCSTEGPERTAELLKPVHSWAKPLLVGVGPMPFPVLQSLFDGLYPPGLQWYWKADFVDTLTDEAIAQHMQARDQPAVACSRPCTCIRSTERCTA